MNTRDRIPVQTLREMVLGWENEKLELTAVQSREGESWRKYSYRELRDSIRNVGNALLAMGAEKGTRIGLLSENRPEWPITYLAAASIGAVIVPFDILLKNEELETVMKAGGIRFLFTSSVYLQKTTEVESALPGGKLPTLEKVICFDGYDKMTVRPVESIDRNMLWQDLIAGDGKQQESTLFDHATVAPNDTCALIFTSGTTGNPKGVMLSHANLLANAEGLKQGTVLGPGDNWIIVLPYHHAYPTILGVILPFYTYGTVTTVPTLRPNILFQAMKETGATCIPSVPALIEKIYKGLFAAVWEKGLAVSIVFYTLFLISRFFYKVFRLRIGKYLFGSIRRQLGVTRLKFFISGAGPIPKKIIDGMEILGLTVMQGYGLTESSPVISSTFPENNKPGTVGRPLMNVEVRIDQPDKDGHGELLTRGPHVMKGYYNDKGMTAQVIDGDGWLHTGDIACIDKDGYITISGRMKNVIVTKGGKNIYPEEIENRLLESEYISEVLVIPRYDQTLGEYPHAVIVPNMEAIEAHTKEHSDPFGDEELEEFISREIRKRMTGLANYKTVRGFEISKDELPKTSSKKVRRHLYHKK